MLLLGEQRLVSMALVLGFRSFGLSQSVLVFFYFFFAGGGGGEEQCL